MISWLDSEVSLVERYVQINEYSNKYTSVIIIANIYIIIIIIGGIILLHLERVFFLSI